MEELCANMVVSLIGIIVTCALLIMCGGSVWLHAVTKALCVNGGGMVDCGAVHQASKLIAGQREEIVEKSSLLGDSRAEITALRRARLVLRGPSHREKRTKKFQIREG